jgi:hypothetical protein
MVRRLRRWRLVPASSRSCGLGAGVDSRRLQLLLLLLLLLLLQQQLLESVLRRHRE